MESPVLSTPQCYPSTGRDIPEQEQKEVATVEAAACVLKELAEVHISQDGMAQSLGRWTCVDTDLDLCKLQALYSFKVIRFTMRKVSPRSFFNVPGTGRCCMTMKGVEGITPAHGRDTAPPKVLPTLRLA